MVAFQKQRHASVEYTNAPYTFVPKLGNTYICTCQSQFKTDYGYLNLSLPNTNKMSYIYI